MSISPVPVVPTLEIVAEIFITKILTLTRPVGTPGVLERTVIECADSAHVHVGAFTTPSAAQKQERMPRVGETH